MKCKLLTRIWYITKCALWGFFLSSFFSSKAWANNYEAYNFQDKQDIVITGKVTDENGAAIPGANILEKGTRNGVISDHEGNYTLKVKGKNSKLVISYVGYTNQEIQVRSLSSINIKREPLSKRLDDVIVVGYGTQKRSEITN